MHDNCYEDDHGENNNMRNGHCENWGSDISGNRKQKINVGHPDQLGKKETKIKGSTRKRAVVMDGDDKESFNESIEVEMKFEQLKNHGLI